MIGFVGACVVFAALFWLIDVERFLTALGHARHNIIGAVVLVGFVWLVSWSLAFRTVLTVLGVKISVVRSLFVFASALFMNNITPFGQAGGEPVAAAVISQLTDIEYERGLASIASVDAIHFGPSIAFALFGLAYYATFATLGQYLIIATVIVVALAITVPGLLYLAWRYRYTLERRSIGALTPLIRRVGQLIPRISSPSPEAIERRVEGFFATIERIATNRRGVMVALAFSAFGWLVQILMLWSSFIALDKTIPLSLIFLIIPVANIASIVPLPGGLGGIEAVFIGLLVSTTDVNIAIITAAVTIYRTIVYGLPILVGGGTVVLVSTHAYAPE